MSEAGRELDARVAREIMGFEFPEPGTPWFTHCQNCGRHLDDCDKKCRFSSDIAAAWQIVEKLTEQGYHVKVEYVSRFVEWVASIIPETVSKHWEPDVWEYKTAVCAEAKTAPEAICNAALQAISAAP